MGLADLGEMKRTKADLERAKEALLKELERLEELKAKGEISEEEYAKKRGDIERKLVEIMDRLAQLKFLLGS